MGELLKDQSPKPQFTLGKEFLGSKAVTNFLKLFPDKEWTRVSKATILVGITRLAELAERTQKGALAQLSVEDVETLAVKTHERYVRHKLRREERMFEQSEYTRSYVSHGDSQAKDS